MIVATSRTVSNSDIGILPDRSDYGRMPVANRVHKRSIVAFRRKNRPVAEHLAHDLERYASFQPFAACSVTQIVGSERCIVAEGSLEDSHDSLAHPASYAAPHRLTVPEKVLSAWVWCG